MILQGKANLAFYDWLRERENLISQEYVRVSENSSVMFRFLPELFQNALIIEWFDSVGICVDAIPRINEKGDGFDFEPNTFTLQQASDDYRNFSSRATAITEAIKQANILYNQSHQ